MISDLLNLTATINTLTSTNSAGDVSESASALHTDIPTRIGNLNYKDQRFVESKEEYANVTKKAFIEAKYTGIEAGMDFVSGGKTYIIMIVNPTYDYDSLHHFELFLQINEPN